MWKIAWCNLYRDRVRFVTALVGLIFAVVLMAVQASIFLGAVRNSSLLAQQIDGDLWIVPYRASNADFSVPMPGRRCYQALGVPGVARTGRMVVGFSVLRFPSGRQEPIIVVGTDTDHQWLPIDTDLARMKTAEGRAVILDRRERWRFGEAGKPLPVDARGEINGHRVFVAGYATGMASFTPTPYAFSSYEAALDFAKVDADDTTFVMVKCEPGADTRAVRDALAERIPDVEVLTKAEFADRSWHYWVMGTGMGYSLGLMAALSLIVGMTIVGQTFVTGVLVKLREYGTLKALGFRNRFVAGTIVAQGVIVALLGYVLGCAVSLLIAQFAGTGGTAVTMLMPPALFVVLLPLTLLMCVTSSLTAAWRVFRLAPAEVFR
ncbi:MAG: FtsX-like permease family protein [Phycisphaerae bacterium]|nr:FtsX-like permease family protein [Phycisphaerae bacterium]